MPPSGRRAGGTRATTGIATASMPGKPRSCRPRMRIPFRGLDYGLIGSGRLQRPRPGAEAGIERHRSLAGVADSALDLREIARGEVAALLQVDAPFSGSADGVGRHRSELDRKSTRLNSSHLGISYAVF